MSVRRRGKSKIVIHTSSISAESGDKIIANSVNCCKKSLHFISFGLCLITLVGLFGYMRSPFTSLTLKDFSVKVDLVGALAPDRKLSKGFKITGLSSPESVAEDDKGNLYTGLSDGRIVRIAPSRNGVIGRGIITNVTSGKLPNLFNDNSNVNNGRPLGLRLQKNKLFVADPVYGIYMVDINTHQIEHATIDINPQANFPNDLYVTKDGKRIYFSDVSLKYGIHNTGYIIPEGICDGRIIEYNIETKEARVVISDLCLCNGVQLSDDESRIFVAELARYRVRIVDMNTWKTMKFINVPMMPDNIRSTGRGTYWVAGSSLWSPVLGFLERNPVFRQILGGLFSQEQLLVASPKLYGLLLEVTIDGEIIQSLHDPDGELTQGISQATLLSDGRIVLSSYLASFLSIFDEKDVVLGPT